MAVINWVEFEFMQTEEGDGDYSPWFAEHLKSFEGWALTQESIGDIDALYAEYLRVFPLEVTDCWHQDMISD